MSKSAPKDLNRVFVVHGQDEAIRESVARFIAQLELEPVILHEQSNRGMSIMDKLIANDDVGFAVVLLTPDDLGKGKSDDKLKPRARQNVVLELGYFLGHLSRERVVALKQGSIEIPSDFTGILYIQYDDGGGWRQKLAQELKSAGYEIDLNLIMGTR